MVAVSDVTSAVHNPKGLDVAALREHAAKGQPLSTFTGGQELPKEHIFGVDCDVLIPAALGGVITTDVVPRLQCKFLVEAANAPTTYDADIELRKRGIVVLPDIYTNAGGVTVSFFEWVQNLSHVIW